MLLSSTRCRRQVRCNEGCADTSMAQNLPLASVREGGVAGCGGLGYTVPCSFADTPTRRHVALRASMVVTSNPSPSPSKGGWVADAAPGKFVPGGRGESYGFGGCIQSMVNTGPMVWTLLCPVVAGRPLGCLKTTVTGERGTVHRSRWCLREGLLIARSRYCLPAREVMVQMIRRCAQTCTLRGST